MKRNKITTTIKDQPVEVRVAIIKKDEIIGEETDFGFCGIKQDTGVKKKKVEDFDVNILVEQFEITQKQKGD